MYPSRISSKRPPVHNFKPVPTGGMPSQLSSAYPAKTGTGKLYRGIQSSSQPRPSAGSPAATTTRSASTNARSISTFSRSVGTNSKVRSRSPLTAISTNHDSNHVTVSTPARKVSPVAGTTYTPESKISRVRAQESTKSALEAELYPRYEKTLSAQAERTMSVFARQERQAKANLMEVQRACESMVTELQYSPNATLSTERVHASLLEVQRACKNIAADLSGQRKGVVSKKAEPTLRPTLGPSQSQRAAKTYPQSPRKSQDANSATKPDPEDVARVLPDQKVTCQDFLVESPTGRANRKHTGSFSSTSTTASSPHAIRDHSNSFSSAGSAEMDGVDAWSVSWSDLGICVSRKGSKETELPAKTAVTADEIKKQTPPTSEPSEIPSFKDSERMTVEDLHMQDTTIDPCTGYLRSELLRRLGFADSALIRKQDDQHGAYNDGIWELVDGITNGVILKLVPHERAHPDRLTDTEKYLNMQRQTPVILQDPSVCFPQHIFRLIDSDDNRCKDLIVMRRAHGMQITQHLYHKRNDVDLASLFKIFYAVGTHMQKIHRVYKGMQHGDCSPSNVFYDEVAQSVTLIDVADFGFGPYVADLGDDDVECFVKRLKTLTQWYGEELIDPCEEAFRLGYAATTQNILDVLNNLQSKFDTLKEKRVAAEHAAM